jgi:hypothetical protein
MEKKHEEDRILMKKKLCAQTDDLPVLKTLPPVSTDEGGQLLNMCAIYNCWKVADYLLAQGLDVEETSVSQSTYLHTSVSLNNFEVAEVFLRYKANILAWDSWDYSPLSTAAAQSNLPMMHLLLRYIHIFGDTVYPCPFSVPLMKENYEEVCDTLFEGGVRSFRTKISYYPGKRVPNDPFDFYSPGAARYWERTLLQIEFEDSGSPYELYTLPAGPLKRWFPFRNKMFQWDLAKLCMNEEAAYSALFFRPGKGAHTAFVSYEGPISETIVRFLVLPTAKKRSEMRDTLAFSGMGLTRKQAKYRHLVLTNIKRES